MTLSPGLRVVRGPDWQWGEQDGGRGHAGTVISFGRQESEHSPRNTANVRWDRGLRGDYRMGFGNAFDLCILDNATVGDVHPDVKCNECQQPSIRGTLWRCKTVGGYNLCSQCYHGGRTNLGYQFYRVLIPGAKGVLMPKRSASAQTEVKGLFPGAKVIKGSDLELKPEDDRMRYQGKIFSLCEWQEGYPGTAAVVDWPPHGRNTFRLGFRGKVDLKTKNPGSGGTCYLDHLPVLGKTIEMESVAGLVVGDHVTIVLEKDLLKDLQQGHGDWVPGMAEDIGHVGVIREITADQDVMVEYPQRRRKWIFHHAALTKIEKFKIGDSVSITSDLINTLKIQMKNEMSPRDLQKSVGKLATITEVEESGLYQIHVAESGQDVGGVSPIMLQAAPTAVKKRREKREPSKGTYGIIQRGPLEEVSKRIGLDTRRGASDELAIQAAQGRADSVRDLLSRHPEWVNARQEEKSALQLAAYGGFMEVVQLLLETGADVDLKDEDGDTALMYAVYGNHPVIVDYLFCRGADINQVNVEHRSSLHQAVTRGFEECVRILLKNGCSVNVQDNFGDTALHDAIVGKNFDVLSLLFSDPAVNYKLTNKRGYNAVQYAALKGNQSAIMRMISKDVSLAGIPNSDGLTPLHIAAANNFPEIARILVVKGECIVNAYSRDQQTPLLLAVREGHIEVVEVLLSLGADVNAADGDGDTSLHVALLRQVIFPEVDNTILIQKIKAKMPNNPVATSGLALACLLVENKGDLEHVNNKGQTPLDLVPDTTIRAVLRRFITKSQSQGQGSRTPETRSNREEGEASGSTPQGKGKVSPHIQMQMDKEATILKAGNRDQVGGQISEHIRMQMNKESTIMQRRANADSSIPGSGSDVARTLLSDDSDLSRTQLENDPLLMMSSQPFQLQSGIGNLYERSNQSAAQTLMDDSSPGSGMSLGLELLSVRNPPMTSSGLSPGATATSPKHLQMQSEKELCLRMSQDPGLIPREPSPIPRQPSPIPRQPSPIPRQPSPVPPSSEKNGVKSPVGGLAPLIINRNTSKQYHQEGAAAGGASSATPFSLYPLTTMPTNTPNTLPPNLAWCRMQGCGRVADSKFMPCGHIVVCAPCSECFKLCHECRNIIEDVEQLTSVFDMQTNASPAMGQQTLSSADIQFSDESLTRSVLIQKNRKLVEQLECPVCMNEKKEFVFMCGHSFCGMCTESLDDCPICRRPIQKKIKVY